MKVLVLSDSHGAVAKLRSILEREADCETVFFLGDGLSDIEKIKNDYPDRKFITVKGNCDLYAAGEKDAYKYIDGITIFATHGDLYSVKYTLNDLIAKLKSVRGNLALYGHTHKADLQGYPSGIFAVNPGAVCDGKYCVLDIEKGQFEYYPKVI